MSNGYFNDLKKCTGNRLWINNPTLAEADLAIGAGAIGCTTNPTFIMKQLKAETEHNNVIQIIDEVIKTAKDDSEAALQIQRKMVARLINKFQPLYNKHPGEEGFVSIQIDPFSEDDADLIIKEAITDIKLGKNVIPKIPVTEHGLEAIEYLVANDIPVLATEVMSISQAIQTFERYQKVSRRTGNRPPLFVTHITGIFDDYIKNYALSKNISVSQDLLKQAGTIVARKQYKIKEERGYPGIMLGGGARGLHHFTEFVGSDMHITVNWKGTAEQLVHQNPPIVPRMDITTPLEVLNELLTKLPDFCKAYEEDGLSTNEFKDYGAVVLFRDSFIEGWNYLLETIRIRRNTI